MGLFMAASTAVYHFAPVYLLRVLHMSPGEVGTGFGLALGLSGGVGTVIGGALSDRLARRDERWSLWLPALCMVGGLPCFLAGWWLPGRPAMIAIGIGSLLICTVLGPAFAIAQSLVDKDACSSANAAVTFVMYAVGFSLGPIVTGWLSDTLKPRFGEASLRYALMITSLMLLWSAFHFLRAARTLRQDKADAESQAGT
jgi:MFS family permease